MGFMMLLVIGVIVIIALKIAKIPRHHVVSLPGFAVGHVLKDLI